MAESRSLMVRSGIMTSFCATTLVTPSFVTVFMTWRGTKRKEKKGLCLERTVDANRHPASGRKRGRKIGEHGMFQFMGFGNGKSPTTSAGHFFK